jgi:hypothetical protein
MVEIASDLSSMYDGYYGAERLEKKRWLAAQDSADHLYSMLGGNLGSLVDVGAGDGSLLETIGCRGWATKLSGLEISATGIEAIEGREINGLSEVKQFDGYTMPYEDGEFDTALCVHVLEHVEHERLFLRELGRIGKRVFIEVPLEGGFRGRVNREYGHINYYSPEFFLNLLETSDLRVMEC